MSHTEIFGFNNEGNAYHQADIKNAWRSGMAIWNHLEKKYLPPYLPSYTPAYIKSVDEFESRLGYRPTRTSSMMDGNAMKEIWSLADDDKVSLTDKIVLLTTFDKVLIKKEDLPKVISAFKDFDGETSLKEQAQVLQTMFEDEGCIAVGWNQTSVNGDTWMNIGGYNEDNEESIPYNCLKQSWHHWLFDELDTTQ
jgi:hypothetical protein